MSTIFDESRPGRRGAELRGTKTAAPAGLASSELRHELPWPELSEPQVVRHFVRLSRLNHAIDVGFYPLGSCTMKYNPKINEEMARLPGFASLHPLQPEETVQGALQVMWELQRDLAEITGMDQVSLQPAAGAQGEQTGILMIKAYHRSRQDLQRTEVLIPDAAHGTNPATASLAGFDVVEVASDSRGGVDLAALKAKLGPKTAAVMLTNPSTLGIFEDNIVEIARLTHQAGGLLYYDGANLNAILGKCRPGDTGFDVVHVNLHKTFSTPHGGGGPGSGPVGVKKHLAPFLPAPTVGRDQNGFHLVAGGPDSIGRVRSFHGNFGMHLRAYTYIRSLGKDGLSAVAEDAVLNANYLLHLIKDRVTVPYQRLAKHEFVVGLPRSIKDKTGVRTLDVAKRLLDFGVHSPTVYFPLIVDEAMMIEPTETESKETLEAFAEILAQVLTEAVNDPEMVKTAPHTTPVRRLDEARAARQPELRYRPR
ncbi:MAG: aminomethyl-transferring glycine dehydrogenase subunit GcvPB [Sulfobacillus sp.]